jgi:uncharacterized RDD family membrane protein YckC
MPPAAPPPAGPPPAQPGYGAQPAYGSQTGYPQPTAAWAAPAAAETAFAVPGAPGLRFAGTLGRFVAYWIDLIIVGIGAGVIAGVIGSAVGGRNSIPLVSAVLVLGIGFLYFYGLWTSGARATLGMRLMKLQVGNAFDGRTLTTEQAVKRWVALGLPLQALEFIAPIAGAAGGILFLWWLVLLITTATSPTRQGLHDRFARSAIVQPIGASTPAAACLVIILILLALSVLAIIALIFLGSQVSGILPSAAPSP